MSETLSQVDIVYHLAALADIVPSIKNPDVYFSSNVNSTFNLVRKVFLATAPFTHGFSLLPYGPIAIIQAAISVRSTKIIGKLAAREIYKKSKGCLLDPSQIIKKIIMKDPELFNHTKIYLSNKNLENNYAIFLP